MERFEVDASNQIAIQNLTFKSKESVESCDNSIIYKFTAQIGAKTIRHKKKC